MVDHCYDFYTFSAEDTTSLALPKWKRATRLNEDNTTTICPKAWEYVSQKTDGSFPTLAYFTVYNGGGYVVNLGYNKRTVTGIISDLRKNNWIDQRTRVVIIEFTIFNPNTNYLSVCTAFLEILPTGYGHTYERIETFPLYSSQTGFYEFYLVCQLFFIIFVIYYVVLECFKVYHQKLTYFRNLWNWIEILQLTSALLGVMFYLLKARSVISAITRIQANPYKYVNFQQVVAWCDAENVVLSLAISIATVKILKMIRFNYHINVFSSTMRVARRFLVSYSAVLFVIYSAFAMIAHLVFGRSVLQYSSFKRTLEQEFVMTLGGKLQLDSLIRVNRILGPLIGFLFKSLILFIFLNFFVAILNDSYSEVNSNLNKHSKDFEMADYIQMRLKTFFFDYFPNVRVHSKNKENEGIEVFQNASEDKNTDDNITRSSLSNIQNSFYISKQKSIEKSDSLKTKAKMDTTQVFRCSDQRIAGETLSINDSQSKPKTHLNDLKSAREVSIPSKCSMSFERARSSIKVSSKQMSSLPHYEDYKTKHLDNLEVCNKLDTKGSQVMDLLEFCVAECLSEDIELMNLILIIASSTLTGDHNPNSFLVDPLGLQDTNLEQQSDDNPSTSYAQNQSLQHLKWFLEDENWEVKTIFRRDREYNGVLPKHLRFQRFKSSLLRGLRSNKS